MRRGPHTPDAMLEEGGPGNPLREARDRAAAVDVERPSDDELVREALAGDERPFEVLLRRHEATVVRVLRLLGVPARDRDDVAQEIFLRVFRYLGGFRPGRPFSGWIYRITVNAAHDYRARAGRAHLDEVEWPAYLDEAAGDVAAHDRRDEDRELRHRLEAALAVLSERERAVFVLRELEGLSTREVGRSLGITGITVRRHLGRARRALQGQLSASSPTHPEKKRSSR